MKQQFILMDGSVFLFRAYFATLSHNLTNKDGFPTGAIFGVINAIKNMQRMYPQARIVPIFDAIGGNFRHDIFPAYKANRKPTDEGLKIQINPLHEILRAMGFHFLCVPRVESDDVVATLSKLLERQGIEVIIASSDKDLFQLVNANIKQLDMHNQLLDEAAVFKKIGVRPNQVLDFLTLTGDSSDNVSGVPGVGPKTAIKWLLEYGNISNIKKNAMQISGSVGEKLRNNFTLLDLSYKLISLKFDVALPCNVLDDEPGQDDEKLIYLYKKYGFSTWFKQLQTVIDNKKNKSLKQNIDNSKNLSDNKIEEDKSQNKSILEGYTQTTIFGKQAFEDLLVRLNSSKEFVFDLETNSLDYMSAEIVGLVFLVVKDSFYLPVAHNYVGAPEQLKIAYVLNKLTPILTSETIFKIGQNIKYDAHVLANYSIILRGISDDIMLKSYCVNSVASRHNMDDLAVYYLDHKTIHFTDVAGIGKKQVTFNKVTLDKATSYACEDVIVTHELNKVLSKHIAKHPQLETLYKELELPLIYVLIHMERSGVKIDVNAFDTQKTNVLQQIKYIKSKIFAITKCEFNLESPKQVQQVLFTEEGLGLTPKKLTPSGQSSTNEEALKLLDNPVVDLILKYRMFAKLNSTYLDAMPKQINLKTKRLHTSYHQAVTATGRLSSSNPNLQNIPIKSKEGAMIREAFIAAKDNSIIAADYSQIELRIMAHLSKDSNLLEAFNNNLDVHNATAVMMFNVTTANVTKTQRRNAKAINFGLIYGMSAFGLAKHINVSKTEAQKYIEAYFTNYPMVYDYMESVKKSAQKLGYVETITGRRLYLDGINSANKMRRQHVLRSAINAPMQGSSADIIKFAMLDIYNDIRNNKNIKMIMQVHDELIFEVNTAMVCEFTDKIRKFMSNACNLDIPLVVDIGVGDSWQQAH